ncbi:cysteine and glycine-rich protein 1-like isoform X2 [Phthorimaea operculella]|nr:cysteine and glycine-rich protein 1-like isoform X2 [Phthorimaea operculella]
METKTENKEQKEKKCFCARCFLPIEPGDKVEVDGHNFHKMCSMCCVCRQVPSTIKLFYGHVFCPECFKNHVLHRFKGGEPQRMYSNSWWMQWAPGAKQAEAPAQEKGEKESDVKNEPETEKEPEVKKEEKPEPEPAKCEPEEPLKRCICARCLQPVDPKHKVEIAGQCFHPQCCRCYCCHQIPKDNLKIYYGQVFCEECFNRFVMAPKTPAEHYRNCFQQMQAANTDAQFAEGMREFMAGQQGKEGVPQSSPMIFMMPPSAHPPYCRCGNHPQAQAHDWLQANEPRKCEQSA